MCLTSLFGSAYPLSIMLKVRQQLCLGQPKLNGTKGKPRPSAQFINSLTNIFIIFNQHRQIVYSPCHPLKKRQPFPLEEKSACQTSSRSGLRSCSGTTKRGCNAVRHIFLVISPHNMGKSFPLSNPQEIRGGDCHE